MNVTCVLFIGPWSRGMPRSIRNTSRLGASRHAGLILIHRFPLSLPFHNHRSLPVPIRGYHLQTLITGFLTLPFSSYNDDDRALRDMSADSTMTSPLLCDQWLK